MLALSCPRCGRPASVNFAAPHLLRCVTCGFAGPPPPDGARRIEAARAALFGFDARLRQLSRAQRQNLFTASQKRLVFLVLSGVVFVPFAFWALAGVIATVNPEDPTSAFGAGGLLITWGPMLLFVLFSALGYRAVRAKQRLLDAACVARPPLAVGEPSSCHVCGAPLAAPSGHTVLAVR
jgi:ribosomal protein S27E